MNFPKQVKTRSVVILLSCLLVLSSVSMYYAFSASTPTSGLTDIYIEPPMMESSYIIGFYTAPTTCYLKNGTTGQIVSTGNFYSCMQGAINALTTGGKIFLRAGKYNLTAALVMWQEGIWIEGEGTGVDQKGTVIYDDITYTGVSTCMIYFTELAGTTHHFVGGMSNVFLQGRNRADIDGIVIHGYWSDLYFDKVIVLNFEDGIVLNGTGKVYAGESKLWNIFITDCLIEDNVKYGIYFTGTSSVQTMIDRIKISNCHFYNNRNDVYCDTQFVYHISFIDNTVEKTAQACINVTSGGRQWIITDNHIFDCGIGANGTYAGIFVNGTGTFYPDSWLIENNIIANHFTSAPVAMNNSIWLTGTVTNFVIQGNFFFQASEPIRIDGLTSYSSIKVNGNNDYAKNLVFPSENRPYSYLIGTFKSSYYMLNCSTGYVDYQGTNFTNVWNFAGANTTLLGGSILVKAGSYSPDGYLWLYSNVAYQGEGYGSLINVDNPAAWTGSVQNVHGAGGTWDGTTDYNITVRDLRFRGSGTAFTSKGFILELHGAEGCLIDHCWVENAMNTGGNWGIMLNGETATTQRTITQYNTVKNCFVTDVSYDAIHIKDVVATYGTGAMWNTIQDNFIGTCQVGIATYNTDRNTIRGNTVQNATLLTAGGNPVGICDHGSIGTQILGNTINQSQVGIGQPDVTGVSCYGGIVEGNTIYVGVVNSIGYATQLGSNTTFSGNSVFFPVGYSQHGIMMGSFCSATGNFVNGTYWANGAFEIDGDYNIINENTFVGFSVAFDAQNSNKPIKFLSGAAYNTFAYNIIPSAQWGGVTFASGSTYNVVEHNIFTSAYAKVDDSGTGNVVRWNTGWKTEGSASSNNATTTTWTFTMGNVSTVLRAYISFNSTIADPYWSATGNTLTVTTGTIIAANNTSCYVEWYCWNYP